MKHLALRSILLIAILLSIGAKHRTKGEFFLEDTITAIEKNTVYDTEWKSVTFVQWIFWNDQNVIGWKWYRKRTKIRRRPDGLWEMMLHYEDSTKYTRIIRAHHYYETHSNYDREVQDRKNVESKNRHGLRPPNKVYNQKAKDFRALLKRERESYAHEDNVRSERPGQHLPSTGNPGINSRRRGKQRPFLHSVERLWAEWWIRRSILRSH